MWQKMMLLTAALVLVACTTHPRTQSMPDDSLFNRMGGMPVITQITDEFVDQVASDPKTKRSFEGIKLAALKESIANHFCELTGGGCQYEGETMLNSHRDAQITEAEFEAFVSMFRVVLDKYVGTREKNELLKILAPMKRDIVHDPKRPPFVPAAQETAISQ